MEGFIGEIRAFSGNYAPEGWNFCDGTILSVTGYEALYSLIGNTYGGSAPTTFALPDLKGRLPIGLGTGTGLTPRIIGQNGGAESVLLNISNLPIHTHLAMVSTNGTPTVTPSQLTYLSSMSSPGATVIGYLPGTTTGPKNIIMDPSTILPTGGGYSHENTMPCMAINYIICISNNLYPQRQ